MFSYSHPYNFTISLIFVLALNQNAIANSPYISEIVAANDNSLRDNFDESSDWIEIFNPEEKPLNLDGWGLSDKNTWANKLQCSLNKNKMLFNAVF